MVDNDISIRTNDFDTLGGRLCRARDAIDSTPAEIAGLIGVELKTLRAWESDRSEPRSNKLTMLAAALGVSPSWLLYGRGTSPVPEAVLEDKDAARQELANLKEQQKDLNSAIEAIEAALRQNETE